MSIIVRNDEQIQVGSTIGFIAGSSSFTFDGVAGKPYYIGFEIVVSELTGRGIMVRGVDFSWNKTTGVFQLLQVGDIFIADTWYNVHFEPKENTVIVSPTSIIDVSFFVRDINIPNISNAGPILDRLNSFILRYEPQCLQKVLGIDLYELFLTENSQRMTDLLYGKKYTDYYGKKVKWEGIVHDGDVSFIAHYIYYFFQEVSITQTTGVSETSSLSEGGITVSPADKMLNAWNFFSHEVRRMVNFIGSQNNGSSKVYPEFTYQQSIETIDYSRPNNLFGF